MTPPRRAATDLLLPSLLLLRPATAMGAMFIVARIVSNSAPRGCETFFDAEARLLVY